MPVPNDYEAATSTKIDAENDLNPFDWEVRTIADVELVTFTTDDGEDSKLMVTVEPPIGDNGTTFICNRTRERALSEALRSKRPNDWIGKQIAIRQGTSNFRGKSHKVVEVCNVSPTATGAKPVKPQHTLQDGDNIPF